MDCGHLSARVDAISQLRIGRSAPDCLNFHPESPERTPLDPFRLALSDLGRHITEVMQAEAKNS